MAGLSQQATVNSEVYMRDLHYHDLSIMHDSLHMYVSKSVITSCVFRKERVKSVK